MSEIDIVDITTKQMHGTGVFDELMETTRLRLIEEFDKGRITGDEYATVFLGSMQTVMSQSISFLLQRQEAAAKADLLKQQILNEKQGILKSIQEVEILKESLLKTRAEVRILAKQEDKIDAEIKLYAHKGITEAAQTGLTVDTNGNPVTFTGDVKGIVEKQKNLYQAQTDGFQRKAEQAAAKIFADIYAVRRSTDESLIQPKGLRDSVITGAMTKLYQGINGETPIAESTNSIP